MCVCVCEYVCSVVLEQGQQVVVVVVREVWRSEVRQQLVWVRQLRKQLQKQTGDIFRFTLCPKALTEEPAAASVQYKHLSRYTLR